MKILKDGFRADMERIKRELTALQGVSIHVGILGDAGSDILMIAGVHEYGATISAKNVKHIQVDDERNANLLRTQILRFNDELIDDKHHTREHFIEILAVIDAYEDYCRSHPDYKNNRCICAVANIKRVYNERLQKHDFL